MAINKKSKKKTYVIPVDDIKIYSYIVTGYSHLIALTVKEHTHSHMRT